MIRSAVASAARHRVGSQISDLHERVTEERQHSEIQSGAVLRLAPHSMINRRRLRQPPHPGPLAGARQHVHLPPAHVVAS